MQYQAEVQLIRSELGGLEQVRSEMGLSRRKMCQLLMVDPSAWTRWTRNPDQTPPHVWRLLQMLSKQTKGGQINPQLNMEFSRWGSLIRAETEARLRRWSVIFAVALLGMVGLWVLINKYYLSD